MRAFLFLSILFLGLTSASSQVFKAGAAVRVITPDPLLPVSGGVGSPNPVTEKKGDLYVRALVFENCVLQSWVSITLDGRLYWETDPEN